MTKPRAPLEKLACMLIGASAIKRVPIQCQSGVDTLRRLIKKQFGSTVKARDLMLFPTKRLHGGWFSIHDEKVAAFTPAQTPKEVETLLPRRGVIHVLAKECPAHPVRAARWEEIQEILPPLEPTWSFAMKEILPSKKDWHELFERVYEPQMQRHTQQIEPVDATIVDELMRKLREPNMACHVKEVHDRYLFTVLSPASSEHPDLSLSSNARVDGFRAKYHGLTKCGMHYKGSTIFVGETKCVDVKQGIAQVLTQCEAVADSNDLHEVYGAVVTKDGKWIFLHSLDDKILIDDDDDNRLVFDDKRWPSRESVAKIAGKLYGMVLANVPEPDACYVWEEEDEEEEDDDD